MEELFMKKLNQDSSLKKHDTNYNDYWNSKEGKQAEKTAVNFVIVFTSLH
jgi:hypothetical protein